MKTTILFFTMIMALASIRSQASSTEEKDIRQTLINSAKAADQSDVDKLSTFLDDNYRIVMNRLFGSEEVMVVDKTTYLSKIESKEWGGDNRKVDIKSIQLNGNTAQANVHFVGEKMSFNTLISLIKDKNGDWKLVSELPTIK